ncbi:hydantoinase B/oxoprolinase family protein [Alphaproteobacteria bacterium]|jgi:N-methylhydantoinase B|nr:hydantoinase B/oxoprolinase family protein [Alphaproteobacteria bacterium]MDC3369990.1 hydantoinase B/oxoprolinase family protein [Alphaproteobacteria bacterium]
MTIDKVTLEILKNHTRAAAESMAYTLYRTAHSTFVKETEDFTTGLTTADGETFATPTELGATWFVGLNYGRAIKMIDDYRPGDICITNDPYSGFVCTHPPDMHIWKPIFYQSEVVAFSVGHIHNTDVGGAVPASLSRSLSEVHQEGIRIPPTKILTKEGINQEILDIFFKNVRAPEQNWGDLKAQIAACNTGERKVQEMIKRFGIETFREGIPELLNYAENQARAIVRNLPNGKYEFWDYIDEDAVNGWPCRIKLTLVIEDETLILDFTGSDPQLESSMNIPTGGDPRHVLVLVGVVYVLYSLNPKLYLNSGITRICKCILPSGTMVNPEFPAAVGMRTLSCNRLHGLTFGAFAQAAPERLMGAPASGGPIMNVNTTDIKTGRRIMAAINPMTGGSGGCADGDGNDGSGANQGFLKNTPTEVNEVEAGILVHRYGLMKNSAGPGKHRGGLGTEMVFEALAPNTKITARNRDRTRFAGWGIVGGKAGAVSAFVRNPGKTNQINLGNTDIVTVDPGDIIYVSCGGAGGWGPPTERDPKAVLHDFKCGWITKQHAREIYGVIISEGSVDQKATTACREIKKSESNHNPSDGFYNVSVSQQDFEKVWTKQNYEKLTEGLAKLPISWRFFAKHQIFSAIAKMPDNDPSKLDGAAVQTEFNTLLRRFPDLRNRTEA